jgi:hypothetical protein
MGKRAGKTELQQRLDTLMGLKAQGHGPSALIQAAQKAWQVSEREVQRYLKKIKEIEIQTSMLQSREGLVQLEQQLKHLYYKAMANNEHAEAHEILKTQMNFYKNFAITKNIGGHNEIPSSLIPVPESTELARMLGFFKG